MNPRSRFVLFPWIGLMACLVLLVAPREVRGANNPSAIQLGQAITNQVPTPGTAITNLYSFNASPGQRVYFDALTGHPCDTRLRWRCQRPDGTALFDQWFASSTGCSNGDPGSFTLTAPGTYTITVYGNTDATGAYSFVVVPILDQSFAISPGQVVTNGVPGAGAGLIEVPGATDAFTFNASAGQRVYFDALTGHPCDTRLRWRCQRPDGTALFDQWFASSTGCSNGDPGSFTLTAPGTYTITVYGNTDATGAYSFVVVPILDQSFALGPGQVVTNGVPGAGAGLIEVPGATDAFTFNASAGQRVYFDALTGHPCDTRLRWRCQGPDGTALFDQWFASSTGCSNGDPGSFTLAAPGTYTITVYGNTDATGAYSFVVVPILDQSFAISPGQVVTNGIPGAGAGQIEVPGATDAFTFNATAGQRVYFDALTGQPCDTRLRWRCQGPDGTALFDQWFASSTGCSNGDPGTFTLAAPGPYTITVYGNTDATGAYSFVVVPIAADVFNIGRDQVVTNGVPALGAGVIEAAGATDTYRFVASAGQTVYFDALTGIPCDTPLRWRCLGPSQEVLFDQWFAATPGCSNGDPGNVTFTNAGTYSIVVYGDTHFTGSYSFRLITPAPVITTQPADLYAIRGQSVTLRVAADSEVPLQYQWRFNGNPLAGQTNGMLVLSNVQSGQSGSYSVLLQNASGSTLSREALLTVAPLVPMAQAARTDLPVVDGNGVSIELFNGIGGGLAPDDAALEGRTPDGSTLSPVVDFPHPGLVINIGTSFNTFFADTATPPEEVRGLLARNFTLRHHAFLRVSKDLDQHPATPEIDFAVGVGSDDGFLLRVGTNVLGTAGDRGFNYTWMPVAFDSEGLYPFTLLFAANATGQSGLELAWNTATSGGDQIIPQKALYLSPNVGDRLITFEEVPPGSAIADQFANQGVLFRTLSGNPRVTTNYPSRFIPTSPTQVFGDPAASPQDPGEVELQFVVPGTHTPAVTEFVSFFVIDAAEVGARVRAFDSAGVPLVDQSFHGGGGSQQLVTLANPRMARIRISLGQGNDTAAIDDLAFTSPVSGADLVAAVLQAPATASPGSSFPIVWSVTNVGITSVSGSWIDQVILSPDNSPGADVILAAFTDTATLAPGASLIRTQQVTFPISGPAGTLRFGVRVDASLEIPELNERNNTAFAVDPTASPAWLTLLAPDRRLTEGANPIRATVFRNGDLAQALTVTLSNSSPAELQAPTTLVFAARQSAVDFEIHTPFDGKVDGEQSVRLTVSAPGFISAETTLTLEDVDLPRLELRWLETNLVEGSQVGGMVTREIASVEPLTVFLADSLPDRLLVPLSVTIPANERSTVFAAVAVDDSILSRPVKVSLTAYATRHRDSPPTTLLITDNDLPAVTLTLAKSVVSEGAGPQGTTATLARTPIGNFDLTFVLASEDPGTAQIPTRITLPAGQGTVSFPISVIDNTIVSPARDVVFTATAIDATTGTTLAATASATLRVNDDDGPVLQLTLDPRLVGEGLAPASTATVRRSGPLSQPLIIQLTSSDSGEANVPASVTIPAGQSSVNFAINSLQDGTPDGSQRVTVVASAPGFGDGSDVLVVSDATLPDLIVSQASLPSAADTESFVNATYRLVNQGATSFNTNVTTRLFLSRDAVVGDDLLLGQFDFTGSLPPRQFFEQTVQVRLPTMAGNYWLVVATDVENHVTEILEDNNVILAPVPLRVREAYTATVATDSSRFPTGTPITLRGRAVKAESDVPAPRVPVHVHLRVRDTDRVLLAVTDDFGEFSTVFEPLPNEAGSYEIAAAHPGAVHPPTQQRFTIVGLRSRPPEETLRLIEQVSRTVDIPLENLSEIPLTGLRVSSIDPPAQVTVTPTLVKGDRLESFSSNTLRVVLLAGTAGPPGTVHLRVESGEGVLHDLSLPIRIESLQSLLTVQPGELVAGMKRGGQAVVEFDLVNAGGAATGPISVLVPDLPFLRVASSTPLPPLAPGQSNRVSLQLTPAADLPLGDHSGALIVQSGALAVSVPFRFRALSEAKGDLQITAVDEYTYYAEGAPRVTNAVVVVRDAVSGVIQVQGTTDAAGQFSAPGLVEGYYDLEVTADQHVAYRGISLVGAGLLNEVQAFLSRETVRYLWTVVPTEIEDRTRISIETVFETFVPIPVVTIEPNVIDLAELTAEVTQIDLRISNHGLIAANEFKLAFGSHPSWQFEALISEIGTLPARSSLVIPLTIRKLKASNGTLALQGVARQPEPHSSGPCSIAAGGIWSLICGTKKSYSTPIQILNVGGDCGGIGEGSVGGGIYGGPYAVAPWFPVKIDCDTNKPPCKEFDLPQFNLSGLLKPLATAFDGLANFYLEKNLWTRTLGLKIETEPEAKGKIGLCCTNDTPVEQISAQLSGEVKLKIGDSLKLKQSESFPDFNINGLKGVLGVDGDLFFGVDATPSFKVSGSYLSGCGRPKPEIEVSITGGVKIKGGVFGTAKAKFKVADLPLREDSAAAINGGIQGGLEFTYTYKNTGETKFCYKSEGLYVQANAQMLGIAVDMFYPTNKHYLIPPEVICDPPAALLASLGIDQIVERERQRLVKEALAESSLAPQTIASTLNNSGDDEAAGVCARVRLKLDQDLILTRNAFNATLEIINDDPATDLRDLSVQVNVFDADNRIVNERFDIRTNRLNGLDNVEGSGVVPISSSATASWLLVPNPDAAPEVPTAYRVGGVLSYRQGGRRIVVPFTPVPITVHPDPRLHVQYFHQRDVYSDDPFTSLVEPSIPYSLAVMIRNSGRGIARNVQITSAQPQIVENEKGLLIDFKILGTEVSGHPATPSLTVGFGTLIPDEIGIGRWLLTSTLQGLFVDYQASIQHTAGPLAQTRSLVEEVSIHEMIHLVQAPAELEDGRPDFLVNDLPDAEDLPETLYLSDGSTNRVVTVRESSITGQLFAGNLSVQLNSPMPGDWAYLRVPDPGAGQFKLERVVRSDGRVVPFGTNVWATDRTFIGQGRKPRRENLLHLLDHDSTGTYTLFYGPPVLVESQAPTSHIDTLPTASYSLIPVTWSGIDNPGGTGIDTYDIYVSINGAPFDLWLHNTDVTGAVYTGKLGNRYAFSSVATDRAGNREVPKAAADTETIVSRENHSPTLAPIPDQGVVEGDVLIVPTQASDPDGDPLTWAIIGSPPLGVRVDPVNGLVTWPTGEGLGPSVHRLTVQVLDNGLPRLGATRTFTVTVQDNNAAPALEPYPPRAIDEGRLLRVSSFATDIDLPVQRLTFSFAGEAPRGATVDPFSGEFSWRPDPTQGGTTNVIGIRVTDNGVPNLTTTQSLTIVVRDTRSDFALNLGTTNLNPGASGFIPVSLVSLASLTNVDFQLELPGSRLGNLRLEPRAPEVGNASLSLTGPNHASIRLAAVPGQILPGDREIARLAFTADEAVDSAVIRLVVTNLQGVGSSGIPFLNASVQGGRVFLVGTQPILDARISRNGTRELVIFGHPSKTYEVQQKATFASADSWTRLATVTLVDKMTVVPAPDQGAAQLFYRAVELVGTSPSLSLVPEADGTWTLWIHGEPARSYWLESTRRLGVDPWVRVSRTTLSTRDQAVPGVIRADGSQYFRLVSE